MGGKRLVLIALVLTLTLANARALQENEKARKPMPKFIRRLFQKLFEKDGGAFKEKRETKEPEKKTEGLSKRNERFSRMKDPYRE